MDYVSAEQERNAKTRFFHCQSLPFHEFRLVMSSEKAADSTSTNLFLDTCALLLTSDGTARSHKTVQLSEFLFKGHLGHKFINLCLVRNTG
jgi:hypothetical protein